MYLQHVEVTNKQNKQALGLPTTSKSPIVLPPIFNYTQQKLKMDKLPRVFELFRCF